jgi:rod shape-determining protein MreC
MKNSRFHGPTRAVHQKAAICLILSLMILFVSTKTMVRLPDIFKGYVIGGLQKSFSAVSSFFSRTVGAVSQLRSVQKDYELLLNKMQDYESRERDFAALKEENQRLKELLDLSSLPNTKKMAAHVIARDPSNTYSSLVIDKGYDDGIRKYMPVIAYQDGLEGLVGKIIEVKASTSILQPLYDQRFYAAARLAKTRAEGMINGEGFRDSPLSLLYIPKSEMDQLKQGDIVVTSGLDQVFPPEIMIGRVGNFRLNEFSSSLVIDVQPAIDLSRIEYVFAIDVPSMLSSGKGPGK